MKKLEDMKETLDREKIKTKIKKNIKIKDKSRQKYFPPSSK